MNDARPQSSHPSASQWRRGLELGLRVVWMRLRFVAAAAMLFAVIALWRQIGGYWDQSLLWVSGGTAHDAGISPDTEYFCPMCPGVLSAWPDKCPVCNMPLVRRSVGSAHLLPEGVVARMQVSPYRLQLGGIKTSPVGYLPLEHAVEGAGRLSHDDRGWLLVAAINPWDAPLIQANQPAELEVRGPATPTVLKGRVERVVRSGSGGQSSHALEIRVADPPEWLTVGLAARTTVRIAVAGIEPFRSQPHDPPPLSPGELREYFVCPNHPSWIRAKAGTCPFDGTALEVRPLADDQRLQWSCVLHDEQHFSRPDHDCPLCNRGCRVPQVVTYSPAGQVLAVPESAVIDNGRVRVVFVQTMPDMFDAVEVQLGAKEGGYYPVLAGLAPGQLVASAGAFLLDAETRLNPSLAAAYFGAGTSAGSPTGQPVVKAGSRNTQVVPDRLSGLKLSPDDLILARRQAICPITRSPLGSMGQPVQVEVDGRPVFLCCGACRGKIRGESSLSSPREPLPGGPQP